MSAFGKALIAGVIIFASSIGPVAVTEAQPPIRIGTTLAQTGVYAAIGQNQHRGYQLCVKRMNERGGLPWKGSSTWPPRRGSRPWP